MSIDVTAKISPTARILSESVCVGKHCRIDDGAILTGNIVLGDYVHIGPYCVLTGGEGIHIGDYTGLAAFVSVLTASDDFSGRSMVNPCIPEEYKPHLRRDKVLIGENVIIGSHSVVMPGVNIGDGVSIGAHSLVKHDCIPNYLYGGVPAKEIRKKSMEIWELTKRFKQ